MVFIVKRWLGIGRRGAGYVDLLEQILIERAPAKRINGGLLKNLVESDFFRLHISAKKQAGVARRDDASNSRTPHGISNGTVSFINIAYCPLYKEYNNPVVIIGIVGQEPSREKEFPQTKIT
jgi:hypothetical protein